MCRSFVCCLLLFTFSDDYSLGRVGYKKAGTRSKLPHLYFKSSYRASSWLVEAREAREGRETGVDRAGGQPETAALSMEALYQGPAPKDSPTQGQEGGARIVESVTISVVVYHELSYQRPSTLDVLLSLVRLVWDENYGLGLIFCSRSSIRLSQTH